MSESIEVKTLQPQTVVTIQRTVTTAEIPQALAQILPEVWSVLQQQGVHPAGPPFARYHTPPPQQEMEAGMPVNGSISLPEHETVRVNQLPGGTTAFAVHTGPYDTLIQTYQTIEEWAKQEGYQLAGAPWEVYVTDPGQEPDPSQWKTEVYWPVQR